MNKAIFASLGLALTMGAVGCTSSDPAVPCTTDIECVAAGTANLCDAVTSTCKKGVPRATLIGGGDGTPSSVSLAVIFEGTAGRIFTGFGFNPVRTNELWVVDYSDNSTFIVTNFGTEQMTSLRKRDPAAGHFMEQPTGMSFTADGTWGVCGDNDNSQNGIDGTDFMGPAVFSSDPAIFAKRTADGRGSHLDMLHYSPFCMGIVNETANRYWVFDGKHGAVVRYDFKEFHDPGADDHSDGEIQVYGSELVSRVPGLPSHLAFNPSKAELYVADTGNKRVLKLDTNSGTVGAELDSLEPTIPVQMDNPVFTDLVPPGVLDAPSGMAYAADAVYVGDNTTGRISAYATDGRLLRYLDTGMPAGALGALVVGLDGKLYIADLAAARIYRVDTL